MGFYQYLRQAWQKPSDEAKKAQASRLNKWRKQSTTMRINRPTRLDRARSLGYRAKKGILVVRQRLNRGGRKRPDIKGGRRSKHARQRKVVGKSYQWIAEERVQRKYPNCEVLNSYEVGKDGRNYWFEVILVDRASPNVTKDPSLAGVAMQRHRAGRGLTSAGRKSRGLHKKGRGVEKARPSIRSKKRRLK